MADFINQIIDSVQYIVDDIGDNNINVSYVAACVISRCFQDESDNHLLCLLSPTCIWIC